MEESLQCYGSHSTDEKARNEQRRSQQQEDRAITKTGLHSLSSRLVGQWTQCTGSFENIKERV